MVIWIRLCGRSEVFTNNFETGRTKGLVKPEELKICKLMIEGMTTLYDWHFIDFPDRESGR